MDRDTFTTFRIFTGPGGGPGVRVFQTVASQPSWVIRAAMIAAGLSLAAIMLVLIVPVLVVAVVVFLAAAMVARTRRWFAGLRRPNGMLDGRRNVRVVVRERETI